MTNVLSELVLSAASKSLLLILLLALLIPVSTSLGAKKSRVEELDEGETQHLIFMREEEKLARDVYLALGESYADVQQFRAIDGSEQRHFDVMKEKLEQFGIVDPNTDSSIGVFTGTEYGGYFSEKYAALLERGQTNLLEALYVGAFIEELDMHDIVYCPKVIVAKENGIGEGECGLNYTDEPALQRSYTSLLEGSKDHLRTYVKAIEKIIGKDNYVAQVLSQDEVNSLLGR